MLEISQITQGLKAMAKELAVPVLALSQLSRAVESREDKRPQLADLRESGTIEQDADAVMFIYRDEYYLAAARPKHMAYDNEDKFQTALDKWQRDMELVHNKADLIIEKQRHGPTGRSRCSSRPSSPGSPIWTWRMGAGETELRTWFRRSCCRRRQHLTQDDGQFPQGGCTIASVA